MEPQGPSEFSDPPRRKNRKHTNSRFGCSQCKARKVKCDENRPKCGNCSRRQTPCTYMKDPSSHQLDAISELAKVAASSSQDPNSPKVPNLPTSSPLIPPDSDSPTIGGPESSHTTIGSPDSTCSNCNSYESLSMPHLELLHHFIVKTVHASTVGPTTTFVWQTEFPRLALSHEFLMHALLAIAALHLAHDNPEKKETYWERAIAHEDRALELAHPEMANPNPKNADALFAFCLPTIYYAFAAPEHCQLRHEQQPLSGAIQVINLFRGIFSIMPLVSQWVCQGPLAPLFIVGSNAPKAAIHFTDPETEAYFSRLLVFCSTSNLEHPETYAAAASMLRGAFLAVESISNDELTTPPIWAWAIRLPANFVDALAQMKTVPMTLVAHWCVLLMRVKRYWWAETWVSMTLRELQQAMPPDQAQWLDWPLHMVEDMKLVNATEIPRALPIPAVVPPLT